MELTLIEQHINIVLQGNFNTVNTREIKRLLSLYHQVDSVSIDLSKAHYVNSEAISFLYTISKQYNDIKLISAPPLFKETISLLGLEAELGSLICSVG